MKHRTGHLFKRGDAFYLRWTVNGKVFSKGLRDAEGKPIKTRKNAEEKRVEVMAGFTVGDEVTALQSLVGKLASKQADAAAIEDRENPALTLAEAWDAFKSSVNRTDSGEGTLGVYEGELDRFRKWMEAEHGEVKSLRAVTENHANEYAKHLQAAGLAASTYNQHIGLLARLWRTLAKEYRLTVNPWTEIRRKTLPGASTRRELTLEELRDVCTKAHGEMRLLFALGIYTGLRLGDCATLRWAEVDLHRHMITRVPMKVARRNPVPIKVPVHPTLCALLAETKTKGCGEFVLPESAATYNKARYLLSPQIQEHFKSCKIRTIKAGTGCAAVKGDDGKKKRVSTGKRAVVEVGFHSLRHTFVSLCRASDVPLSVVESLVGHSTPAMTRHYTHVDPVGAATAVNCLPSIMTDGATVKALPPVDPLAAFKEKIRNLVETLTTKNAVKVKAELLAAVG